MRHHTVDEQVSTGLPRARPVDPDAARGGEGRGWVHWAPSLIGGVAGAVVTTAGVGPAWFIAIGLALGGLVALAPELVKRTRRRP